eukprot:224368-Rhodomonas_salina.1
MAKVLFKAKGPPGLGAADAALGPGNAFIGALVRDIVNNQNMQIMHMYGYLKWKAAQREEEGFVETYDAACAHELRMLDDQCSCTAECDLNFENNCACTPVEHDRENIVSFVVGLEKTEAEVRANEGAYRHGIASAANVDVEDVKVVSVIETAERRLGGRKLLATTVDVVTEIGASTV